MCLKLVHVSKLFGNCVCRIVEFSLTDSDCAARAVGDNNVFEPKSKQ